MYPTRSPWLRLDAYDEETCERLPAAASNRSDRRMHIEEITLTNFRCFGDTPTTVVLDEALTAFVGANGTGKTAAFAALGRVFGVTRHERQVIPEDFHVPIDEEQTPTIRELSIEVVVAFPELLDQADDVQDVADEGVVENLPEDDAAERTVPEFFRQMAATEDGHLKCRFRLEATWSDDGSVDGTVAESLFAIRTFDDAYVEEDCSPMGPMDRSRIQMVYVPASRDGARHLTAFLKSRLWKAAQWSSELRTIVEDVATDLGEQFRAEPVVSVIEDAVCERWKHLHRGTFDADPTFRPIDRDLPQLVNKAQLVFTPSVSGHERSAEQLSDGQRSLLQIALTSASIDIESAIAGGVNHAHFDVDSVHLPSLTLLVVEEPENSLSPQFLSRIISQMLDIGSGVRAQALVSSQSASVLGRVDPRSVRHFRLDEASQAARVNHLELPIDTDAEATYVREAVRAFPELYFARFVVLGEGGSEEIVIPRLAEAAGTLIDQSFVAVVPLGGRHVNHFWRLLSGLGIPYVTLLDLDLGRSGGGEGRLRIAVRELENLGLNPLDDVDNVDQVEEIEDLDEDDFEAVVEALEAHWVVFCNPLDLDMTMLDAYPEAYKHFESGQKGPDASPAFTAVLGEKGNADFYDESWADDMRWYRYLFLGRSKPSTHLRALQRLHNDAIVESMPAELKTIIGLVAATVS